jgi:plasmid stability protein
MKALLVVAFGLRVGDFGIRRSGAAGDATDRVTRSRDGVSVMSVVTIRDLDPRVMAALQRRAAEHGRSMEAEARAILAAAVLPPGEGLFTTLHRTFTDLGGVDLELPARTPGRPPVEFRA